MSSCQGELAQKKFDVKAVDEEGRVLFDESIATLPNGFFELWLPRNRRIALSIKRGEQNVNGIIETYDTSKTCLTTLRLR